MRTAALVFAFATLPLASLSAQGTPPKDDPSKVRLEVTGCARGSTLTETSLRLGGGEENPARRWRLRGAKALMNRIKQHQGRELQIVGTTKNGDSTYIAGKRIGKTSIYVGGDPARTSRDPLPDLPTIEVESFDLTGEACR